MKFAKVPYISGILVRLGGGGPTRAATRPTGQATPRVALPPKQWFRLLMIAVVVSGGVWGTYLGAEAQEALADSDDVVLMWQGEPFLCAPLPQGREERAGDQLHEAQQASDAGAIAMFHTGCPPDAPLCACVLRDSPLCQDPDGDGRVSLYDNCPYAANPYQENCDGDYAGDACDSNNVTITYRTEPADTGAVPTGRTTCIYDPDVHSIFFSEVQWTTGTRTIETRQYCGPSGSGTESQVVSEDLDDHSCWAIEYYGCNFNQGGPSPTPVCQ